MCQNLYPQLPRQLDRPDPQRPYSESTFAALDRFKEASAWMKWSKASTLGRAASSFSLSSRTPLARVNSFSASVIAVAAGW